MPLPARIRLTTDTTYHVATTGSDTTGDGSIGNPWRTLQRGYDFFADDLDLVGGAKVVLQAAPGRYSAGIASARGVVGQGGNIEVCIKGDVVNPGSVVIDSVSDCFQFGAGSGGGPKVFIEGFTLKSTGGNGIAAYGGGTGVGYDRIIFLACAAAHLKCAHGAELGAERGAGGYVWVAGNAACHAMAETRGRFTSDGLVVDYQNGPSFSLCTYYCADGEMNIHGMTQINPQFTTGMQFSCQANGTIQKGALTLPGNVAGTIYTGGVVL